MKNICTPNFNNVKKVETEYSAEICIKLRYTGMSTPSFMIRTLAGLLDVM